MRCWDFEEMTEAGRMLPLERPDRGGKNRREIAPIKVAGANMACEVVDRIVDGPDEVHRHPFGRLELGKYLPARAHG